MVADDPQTSLYEDVVVNEQLEQALEDREKLKARAAKARKNYGEANELAKALAAEIQLENGRAVRVGRFVLTRRSVGGRTVQFETQPSSRVTISLLPEDGSF
jgi:RNA-binding protein YhbY